jgi:hypothetical protein
MQQKVQKLLTRYNKLVDVLVDRDDFNLEHIPDAYALKMSDISSLQKGSGKSILVIEPQTYEDVSTLDRNYDMLEYFYEYKSVACMGTGADRWIKVTSKFHKWLKKRVVKLEEIVETKKNVMKEKPVIGTTRYNDKGVLQIYSVVTRWVNQTQERERRD